MKHKKLMVVGAVILAMLTGGTILAFGQSRHEHTFEVKWSSDETSHWFSCVCGEKDSVAGHAMKWIVDAEPTVEAEGWQHPECTECGYAGEAVSIPKVHVHQPEAPLVSDAEGHWQECVCGEHMNQTAHTMEWVIDREATADADGLRHPVCVACGHRGAQESFHAHFAGKEWTSDNKNHWQPCRCGEKMNVTPHTLKWVIDQKATAEADGLRHTTCKTCGYNGAQEPYHTHFAGKDWVSDGLNHWHTCRCGEKMNVTKHTLQWVTDREATAEIDRLRHVFCKTCNYAGKQESYHVHFAGQDWHSDDTNHWNVCRCGQKMNSIAHTPEYIIDREATAEADGLHHPVCTVCSHIGKQAAFHAHFAGDTWQSDDAAH